MDFHSSAFHPIVFSSIYLRNNVFLAPMAGFTHRPFRELAKYFGAGLTFTEMVSVEGILRDNEKTYRYINPDMEGYTAVQLFGGSEPKNFYTAAKLIKKLFGVKMIDLNFGCPVKKVLKGGGGAYLLKNPEKMADIVKAVKDADVFVSAKIRSGFDSVNIDKTIPILDESGVDMIVLHARLAKQFYSGKADWNIFKTARELTSKLLIANGDIATPWDVKYLVENYGVDGVMIGRKALEKPYIFKIIENHFLGNYEEFPPIKVERIVRNFAISYSNFYNIQRISQIKGLLMNMVKELPYARELRREIASIEEIEDLLKLFDRWESKIENSKDFSSDSFTRY